MSRRSRLKVLWRARARPRWRTVTRFVLEHDIEEGWLIVVFAAVIGAGAGFAVIGLYELVDRVRELAGWAREETGLSIASFLAFLTVPLGLWVARSIRRLSEGEPGGEMVPTLIRCSAKRGGELPLRDAMLKLGSAVVTLGSGGSLGAEGPVAVAGASVGSGLGQSFRFGPNRRRLLLACGTAAGISAAFNTPIAGVLFALEVVMGTFAVAALSPVVVASVIGAVVSRQFRGADPAFDIPSEFTLASPSELWLYLLLGLACGALAVLFVRVYYGAQDLLDRLLGQGFAAALVAGVLVAAMGLIHPELLGDGRQGIGLVLSAQLLGAEALALGLMKILTSGLTMAGGGAGGVFTPSLFVGAAFGSFFGLTAQAVFPNTGITPEAYALVGMAAVVAGATFAPLTAIIMIFEMTDDYGLILPLMLVCVISYLVARRLYGQSIYSEILVRQGDRISHGADRSVLENVAVSECYNRDPHVVLEDAPLRKLLSQLKGSRQTEFPVVNRELELVGMLSYQEISNALDEEGLFELLIAADLAAPVPESVVPSESLLEATRKMGLRDIDYIPVVDAEGSLRLLGLLSRRDIMEAYQTHLLLHD
jgi:CIC family chloride channel protein